LGGQAARREAKECMPRRRAGHLPSMSNERFT
jgi:hypothetical protein